MFEPPQLSPTFEDVCGGLKLNNFMKQMFEPQQASSKIEDDCGGLKF